MTRFEGRGGIRRGADQRDRASRSRGSRPGFGSWAQGYPRRMADRLRVACVQLSAGADKADNLATAERLVAEAAADRRRARRPAGEVERVRLRRRAARRPPSRSTAARPSRRWRAGRARTGSRSSAARSPSAATGARSSRTPASCSTPRARSRPSTARSTSSTSRSAGTSTASRRPRSPATRPSSCEAAGWQVGLTICYDLRFPELYRALALDGAELVTVPAAFTLATGKDHWELLLRARAVENQCYVAAANQWGVTHDGQGELRPLGDRRPWGIVLATAPDEDCVIAAELDRERLERDPARAARRSRTGSRRVRWLTERVSSARRPLRRRLHAREARAAARRPGLPRRGRAATGSTLDPDALPRGARRRRSPTSSGTPSSTTTRRSGCASPRTSSAAWAPRGPDVRDDRARDHARLGAARELRALRGRAARARRAARPRARHRPRLEHEPRPRPRSSRHFDLDVDAWVSSGSHGKVKPSPTIFRAALELLGVEPEEAAMVGDSLTDDVEGARALGMRAFLLDRDGPLPGAARTRCADLLALPAALGLTGTG